jgi:uncharacterized protein YkwD
MIRFVAAIIALLISFAACSRTGNPLLPPGAHDITPASASPAASPDNVFNPADSQVQDTDPQIWGAVDIVLDPVTGQFAVEDRSVEIALRHFKVSYFLTAPLCPDCISIVKYQVDQALGIGHVTISIRNPTSLWAYDVRGMIRIPNGKVFRLLNADGYTTLFPKTGYVSPAPFRGYVGDDADHAFAPGSTHFEQFDVKTAPATDPTEFTFLVTAGYPEPPGDVSRIAEFRQSGRLLPGGGTAMVSFDIEDLQDDIGGVCLHAGPLGDGDVWLTESSNGRWEAQLKNMTASPGLYDLAVEANSPNPQDAVTSHVYRAVVFHDLTAFQSQLLTLVNADRASNGLPALQLDPLLCTVAQSHAQDMADQKYFSHTSLDGWSPWDRMSYYGVEFGAAGENIAVGQDTPADVETDWMNSSGHKANILNSSFGKIGLGMVPADSDDIYAPGYYWVQDFTN